MSAEVYRERLTWFKTNEKPEVILLMGEDRSLMQIVLAWTNVSVRMREPLTPLRAQSENATWEWLWENTEYSRQDLIAKSSVPEYGLDERLAVLVGNRVLYPDGTINSFVQRFLREKVLRLFDVKPKRTKKPAS